MHFFLFSKKCHKQLLVQVQEDYGKCTSYFQKQTFKAAVIIDHLRKQAA